MNARIYLAELLGTFMFMMVGYMSVPRSMPPRRRRRTPGRAVLVRVRAAGCDLRVRTHLGRPFQSGRDGRDRPRQAPAGARRRLLHPRPDHRRHRGGRRRPADGQPAGRGRRHHQAGSRHQRHQCAGHRDDLHRDLRGGHPRVEQAGTADRRPGDPADPRGHPLRDRDGHRFVREPGTVDRLRARRWRPERAVDLHRRPDHRRHHRLGRLSRHERPEGPRRPRDRSRRSSPRGPRG